jgi:hypothetical protein
MNHQIQEEIERVYLMYAIAFDLYLLSIDFPLNETNYKALADMTASDLHLYGYEKSLIKILGKPLK